MNAAPETRQPGRALRRRSVAWALTLLLPVLLPVTAVAPAAAASSTWGQVGGDVVSLVAGDQSGRAVSMNTDGTRIAVGAPYHEGDTGTVRIYDWDADSSSWVQLGADIDGEAAGDQAGISVSLSGDGDRVAIGAPLNDGNGSDSGHVRVYEWDDDASSWVQLGADLDGEATLDNSGSSVSLSSDGTRVAIGAHKNDGGGADAGHVRVFQWDSGTSQWDKVLDDIDGAADDWSGYSVSLSLDGSWLAISAPMHNSSEGTVRIYQATGSGWTQSGGDIDGEAGGDESGQSVSLSSDGTRVAIGAHKNDGNGADAGHVRIYDWNGSAWTQAGGDIDGEAAGDQAGVSVSLSSDKNRVAIGAYLHDGNDGNDEDSGQVRIYDWNGSAWSQVGSSLDGEADTDYSGYSVSLAGDGSRVAIGAILSDDGAPQGGHVRVHEQDATSSLSACSPQTTSYTSGSTYFAVVAFKAVGTCSWAIPSGVTMFDWLVVGGGGGGGSWHGAGGGAGGMRSNEGLNVPLDTSFTIQVGAGGDGAPIPGATSTRGSSGGASRITGSSSGLLASVVGGGGGGTGANAGTDGNDGGNGGSGGGAQVALTYGGTVGSGTSGEGNDGGTGAGYGVDHGGKSAQVAGGGGGAGSIGGGAAETSELVVAGSGGAGGAVSWLTASAATALGVGEVSGSDVYFAGGGAGSGWEGVTYTLGAGGLGGGGDGRLHTDGAGEDGATSTGGGGAGSSLTAVGDTRVGGAGGSGVVVLRYAQAPVTLAFAAQGGSGAPAGQTGAPSSTVTLPSTVPTRAGYSFVGWNTSADGSGTAYAAGDTYTLPSSGAATLYARWQANTATLAYDAGGGSAGPASVSGDAGSVVAVSGTVPVWPGYAFTGWNTSADGSGAAYTAGDGFTLPASGVATLHAQWQIVEPVTPAPPPTDEPSDAAETSSSPAPAEASAPPALPEPSGLPFERLVSSDDPVPGEMLTVTAEGFEPDEQVDVYVVADDDMRAATSTVADAEGAVMAEFMVPSDACGELALIVWAPGSGVGFRQDLKVTACGLGEGSDVVQIENASDEDDVVADDDGRTGWWVLALGAGALAVASARRAVTSRRDSGVADTV